MEEVVKLFSMVFGQISALKVVDKFVLSSLTNELTMAETTVQLEKQKRLPNAILSDHGGQFRTRARLSGASRTSTGISSITFRKFSEWLKGKLDEYRDWLNHSCFHRGVKAFPAELYKCNVRKLT